jgi:eukaryotic-like serine/threonine-protein kinase
MIDSIGPGSRVAGRYVIESHLATGGMATVWRARDTVLARIVAVKALRDHLASDPEFRERFRREAVTAARLNHPAIINVFDTGADGVCVFIVMEYFDGTTVAQILQQEGTLEPGYAVDVIMPVLEALAYAHAHGVIHRDVKPGNILVAKDGRVKVTDFGIAKAAQNASDLTTTGTVLGTAQYLSPEQVQGQPVDARSDLYSAGAVLYEMITGRPPFEAETPVATAVMRLTRDPVPPRDIRPGIPRQLEGAVVRALARDPRSRFVSADAMQSALEVWGNGTSLTPPEGIPVAAASESVTRGSMFRSWMLVPILVIAVAAAVIAGGVALGRLELGGPLGVRAAPPNPSSAESQGAGVAIAAAKDHDPFGDGSEHPGAAPLAIDGDSQTAWATDHYSTAQFGQLKPGLGLWLDFGKETRVDRVTVSSPIIGWTFELLPGATPDENGDPLASTAGRVEFTIGSNGKAAVELPTVRTPGLMIWITALGLDGGRFAAAISEVDVRGPG